MLKIRHLKRIPNRFAYVNMRTGLSDIVDFILSSLKRAPNPTTMYLQALVQLLRTPPEANIPTIDEIEQVTTLAAAAISAVREAWPLSLYGIGKGKGGAPFKSCSISLSGT